MVTEHPVNIALWACKQHQPVELICRDSNPSPSWFLTHNGSIFSSSGILHIGDFYLCETVLGAPFRLVRPALSMALSREGVVTSIELLPTERFGQRRL